MAVAEKYQVGEQLGDDFRFLRGMTQHLGEKGEVSLLLLLLQALATSRGTSP